MKLAKKAEQARILYVEGVETEEGKREYPTIAQIALGTGYGVKYLEKICARDKWREQRERFRARVEAMRRENKAKEIAEKAAQLDERFLETAEGSLAMIRKAMVRLDKAIAGGNWAGASRELAALSLATMRSQRVAKLAVGEASDIQRHELPRGEFRFTGGFAPADPTAAGLDSADA
jgi:hypothetical protein